MKRLAIISPNRFKYSETFIHSHVRDLPFDIALLHGGYLPLLVSKGLEDEGSELTETFRGGIWKRKSSPEQAFERYLKKNRPDVVLAEYGPSGVACMDILGKLDIPFLVHFHGYDAYRRDILEEQGRSYPEMLRKAAAIVVVSQDMHRQLLLLGAPREKLHLLPYGVDLGRFSPIDPASNPPHLVSVGRFTAKKAPLLTLRAFKVAVQEVPGATLEMVGEGDLQVPARKLAKELGIGDRVRFPGKLAPEAVAVALQRGRAFVQHSLRPEDGDSEGLPLSVLEALATGLPVIATRHAGIVDAVRHEQEGLLSREGDVDAMGMNMVRLLERPDLAAEMGGRARLRAAMSYSKERYLDGLAELLEVVGR